MKSLKINKEKLVDVTFKENSADFGQPLSEVKEEYPYGLRICLNNDTIKMLGLSEMPEVGTGFNMKAVVKVVSTNEYEDETGEKYTVDLQITDMDLMPQKMKIDAEKLYKQEKQTDSLELQEAGE